MDKYIGRSKYGFYELRYVSENGSAGPKIPKNDHFGGSGIGFPCVNHVKQALKGLFYRVGPLFRSLGCRQDVGSESIYCFGPFGLMFYNKVWGWGR